MEQHVKPSARWTNGRPLKVGHFTRHSESLMRKLGIDPSQYAA